MANPLSQGIRKANQELAVEEKGRLQAGRREQKKEHRAVSYRFPPEIHDMIEQLINAIYLETGKHPQKQTVVMQAIREMHERKVK